MPSVDQNILVKMFKAKTQKFWKHTQLYTRQAQSIILLQNTMKCCHECSQSGNFSQGKGNIKIRASCPSKVLRLFSWQKRVNNFLERREWCLRHLNRLGRHNWKSTLLSATVKTSVFTSKCPQLVFTLWRRNKSKDFLSTVGILKVVPWKTNHWTRKPVRKTRIFLRIGNEK